MELAFRIISSLSCDGESTRVKSNEFHSADFGFIFIVNSVSVDCASFATQSKYTSCGERHAEPIINIGH